MERPIGISPVLVSLSLQIAGSASWMGGEVGLRRLVLDIPGDSQGVGVFSEVPSSIHST